MKRLKCGDQVEFACGKIMKNRLMLAPMTNSQSHEDGTLSEAERNWLVLRAKGGFGLTMTCASHVQAEGKGFPGQLGIFSDDHLPGHIQLAKDIQAEGSLAVVQLHHAGMRSPKNLIRRAPMCPSDDDKTGARAMTIEEVENLRDDFISAALRCRQAGYDGVEIHGAHGYVLCQFLSRLYNRRTDRYGGDLSHRSRLIIDIIDGVRSTCGPDFLVGLRLSPERFGIELSETLTLSQTLMDSKKIDFLDISLWDCFKEPNEETYKGQSLLSYFSSLNRGSCKLTVAGKLMSAKDVDSILNEGVDFVGIGRAAILRHDFPKRIQTNNRYQSPSLPVSRAHLAKEGLSEMFIDYMTRWKGFVED